MRLQTSIKNLKHFKAWFKACDFTLMQSAIAEKKHTLKLGTHQPCTQSLEKVNFDNSRVISMESYASTRMRPVNHSPTRAARRAVIHRVESEYERFDCISDMHKFGVKVQQFI